MAVQIVNYTPGLQLTPPVYLDANFIIASRLRNHIKYSIAATGLLGMFRQNCEIAVSTLTFDETWWGLLREWYLVDTGKSLTRWIIKANPTLPSTYSGLVLLVAQDSILVAVGQV